MNRREAKEMMFTGAKGLILIGRRMVTLRRDDRPGLPWPGAWDLPGGGREGDETPDACIIREVAEEVGLALTPSDLIWRRHYDTPNPAWFFAVRLSAAREADLRLGTEGQDLALMFPADWLARDDTIPHFRPRVEEALAALY